jgi:hypothetical protein
MKKLFFILIVITNGFLQSCNSETEEAETVQLSGMHTPGIKKQDVLYQFYQRYGFTDVCIHRRTLYKTNLNEGSLKGWKQLPMTKGDIEKVNGLENKVDKINGTDFRIIYRQRKRFEDIELEQSEFKNTGSVQPGSLFKTGLYKVNDTVFLLYDTNANLIYQEEHFCDY